MKSITPDEGEVFGQASADQAGEALPNKPFYWLKQSKQGRVRAPFFID